MISTRTRASAMLVAFGAIGMWPATVAAHPIPNDATIVSLSVVPTTGRADVVIRIDGSVTLKHFVMAKPDKIVVDLEGATLGLPAGDAYDGVARGGITRIRYSQFTRTVVRVVLTLDSPHAYDVSQKDGEIHVLVAGMAGAFDPWQVGAATKNDMLARVEPAEKAPAKSAASKSSAKSSASKLAIRDSKEEENVNGGATYQQSQQRTITWRGENTPIADVLAMFSEFTGRTILPSKNVTGTVTANIINLPWDVALREIMNANGYDVTVNPDGVIVVDTFEATAARQSTTALKTTTVRLNYSRAAAVQPMVQARLTRACAPTAGSNAGAGLQQPVAGQTTMTPVQGINTVQNLTCPQRGTVTADTITNSISITDVPTALPELEAYAHSMDLRQPQVSIKAKIIQVNRSRLEGMGLRYDLGSAQQFFTDIAPRTDSTGKTVTVSQIALGGNTLAAIANATGRVPGAALALVYSTALGNFDLTTFLEALQTNTLSDVQAEPQATVLNNRTANLTAGREVPIRVVDAGSAAGNASNAPRAQVTTRQTGVILTVTPHINANHSVQMSVHVENSSVEFQSSDVGAVFPTQKVDNEVLVGDGETAVMGGLTQTTVTYSRSGIPVLVDLPIIGRFFGVTNRQEIKTDLLILLTPHIIDEGELPPSTSGRP